MSTQWLLGLLISVLCTGITATASAQQDTPANPGEAVAESSAIADENPLPDAPTIGDVRCTVRVEIAEDLHDAFAHGPTTEEASDLAVENACALQCVEGTVTGSSDTTDASAAADANAAPDTNAAAGANATADANAAADTNDTAGEETVDNDDEASAEDDPDGVEACVETCFETVIVIGTLCRSGEETVYADGAFEQDPDKGEEAEKKAVDGAKGKDDVQNAQDAPK